MANKRETWPPNLSAYEAFAAADEIYKGYGKSVHISLLGDIMDCKITSSNFPKRLNALQAFGLVTIERSKLSFTPLGLRVVAPVAPHERKIAKLEAFKNIESLKKLAETYPSGHLPAQNLLGNLLKREFNVTEFTLERWRDFIVDSFAGIEECWDTTQTEETDSTGNQAPPPPPSGTTGDEGSATGVIKIALKKTGRYIVIPSDLTEEEFAWFTKYFELLKEMP